ncbi:hypothetical protein R1flu_010706 [Riccia fluitans]|uniref:NF-kappa-B inhibitor-like protein 1 n=1 Tax=Riccia fluitans TaxID=41844 RepID=A0ABD1Z6S9_9MARC
MPSCFRRVSDNRIFSIRGRLFSSTGIRSMASKLHTTVELQRNILGAAALGSVKLLRGFINSHREYIAWRKGITDRKSSREHRKKERRASKWRRKMERQRSKRHRNENHAYSDCENGSRNKKKRFRDRERESRVRRGKRRRKEESGSTDTTDAELSECEEFSTDPSTSKYSSFQNGSRNSKKRCSDRVRESGVRGGKRRRNEESSSESGSTVSADAELSESEKILTEPSTSEIDEKVGRRRGPLLRDVINARDAQGLTPLHHACFSGSEEAVKYLLSEGASVHFRDLRGNTPLHIAAKMRLESVVSRLEKAGADIEAFNDDGETPSDILERNEKAERAKSDFAEEHSWYDHLAGEMSENEWWGESFADAPEPESWESNLESMAEKYQARGVYNDDYMNHRSFYRREKKAKKEKMPSKVGTKPTYTEQKKSYPEQVNLKEDSTLLESRRYNQRWQIFSTTYNLCLSYADIPFPVPEGKEEKLAQVLLQGIDPSVQRDALRKEILKWHPDKFLQKWGPKLRGPDHDRSFLVVQGTYTCALNLNPGRKLSNPPFAFVRAQVGTNFEGRTGTSSD